MQYFENCINPYFIHSGQQSVNVWKLKKLCAGDLGEEHCLFFFCPILAAQQSFVLFLIS